MSLQELATQIYQSPVSLWLRTEVWVIPTVQSIHIVSIAAVVGAALATDLRLAGVFATDEAPRSLIQRHLPWLWTALVILLTTGATMAYAEPYRVFNNPVFWTKMILVLVAFALTLTFRFAVLSPSFDLSQLRWALLIKPLAWASLAIWVAVIFCGRWIAYVI